jgi:hypothetical protein
MTTEHSDIGRESGAVLRTMLQVALQVSEQLTRRREQRLRDATAASERQRHALEGRLRAEQQSAETALRSVHRDRWWTTAQPERIAEQMRLAHTWKDRSPVAADAAEVIEEQLRTRYAITIGRENLDMAAVSAAVQRDISIHQRREAAAAQYTTDGFTVMEEQPRGPGFVASDFLRQFDADDQAVTEDLVRRDPSKWAVHLNYSPTTDTVDATYYCTDVDAVPEVMHEYPTTARQFDERYLDSAPANKLAYLYYTADHTAKENVRDKIRERFGVDATAVDAATANHDDPAATLGVVLLRADHARSNPEQARAEAATADRAAMITDVINPRGDLEPDHLANGLDRDQIAAAWQWHTATNPRTAELHLYGGTLGASFQNNDAFEQYLTHVATDWARENQPDLLTAGDAGGRRERITEAWIENTGADFPHLDAAGTRSVLGPPPPVTSTDIDTVAEWARHRIPRDYERFTQGTGKTKETGEQHLRLRFDIHHAQQWANDHAPALAAQFAQAEASPDRDSYLSMRGELIDAWNAAQRPIDAELSSPAAATDVATEPPTATPNTAPAYDSAERRDADADALRKAGVDEDAIRANSIADISAARPAADITKAAAGKGPRASKGDRSQSQEATRERGSR